MTKSTSNDLCRQLFETAADAILVLQDGEIVDFNPSAAALLGRKRLIGKALLNFVPSTQPDGSSSVEAWQEKFNAAAAGQPQNFEWVFQLTKKRTVDAQISLNVLDFDGQTYAQLSLRNITHRKEAEEELRDTERRLTDIINFLPEGTFVIDTEGKLIAWNKAMEEMTGIKAKDVLGKGDYEYALPFYNERRPILANMAMQPSEDIAKNYPFIEQDGESYVTEVFTPYFIREGGVTVRAKARPLYNAHGELVGAIESVRDITERKRAEEELQDSERRLTDIINFLPEGTFVIDTEGKLIAWNRAMEEMTGIKAKDVLGKGNYEYALPFYNERRPALADMAMHPSEEIAKNYPKLEHDGDSLVTEVFTPYFSREGGATVRAKARPLYNTHGELVGAIESVRDITERRRAEEKLIENHQFLQSVLDSNPQHVFWKDKDLVYLGCNQKLAKAVGLEKPADIVGLTDYDLPWSKEEADFFRSVDREVMESDTPQLGIIEPQRQADGSQAWLETNKVPMHDKEGNVIGIMGTFAHVTERIKTQQELDRERTLLRTLIDNIPDSHIFVKDVESRFMLTNKALLSTLGASSEDEVIGKTDFDYLPRKFADEYFADEQTVVQTGEPVLNKIEPVVDQDGVQKWYLTHKIPLKGEDGLVTGLVGLSLDISERLNAEQRTRQSEGRLRAFVNALPDVAFIQDADGQYLEVLVSEHNPRYKQIEDMLKGKRIQDVTSPEQAEQFISTIKRALETQEAQLIEYSIKEGVWYEGRVLPIPVEQGDAERVVWLARDITDRKQAEQALQQSEQRFGDIIEFLPTPTFAIDKEGKVIIWNQAIVDVTGVEAEEILGKGNYEYALPFFGKRQPLLIDLIFESEEEVKKNYTNVRRDGNRLFAENLVYPLGIERYYDLSATGLYDSQGELVGAIENFRDITEQKQIEKEIKNSLTRREREVQISTQVSQEIAALTDEQDMYNRVISTIKEQFDFYNMQLFRYDSAQQTLDLRVNIGDIVLEDVDLNNSLVNTSVSLGNSILVPNTDNSAAEHITTEVKGEIIVPIKLGLENAQAQKVAIETFIEQEFNGLIICGLEADIIKPATKKALAKGIPVITQSLDLGDAYQSSYVGANEYKTGYTLGQQAGQWATKHAKSKILEVGILSHRAVVPQREKGIIAGLNDSYNNVKIVANETAANPLAGRQITEQWVQTYPDLRMVLAINDGGALGAYQAFESAEKNDPTQFFVGGVDAVDEALTAIAQGKAFQATVYKTAKSEALAALTTLIAALNGEPYLAQTVVETKPVNPVNLTEILAEHEAESQFDWPDLDLRDIKIGLSVMDLNNPWFIEFANILTKEANQLGIEIVVNDPKQVLGALAVQSDQANTLDAKDQLALEGLAAQIAVAIENLRLLEETSIFRRLAEASGQGLGIANLDGSLIYINPTLGRIVDIENPETLVGKNLDQYYPTEMQLLIQQEVLPAVMESGQWVGELALRATSGKVTPTIENFFVIYDDNDQPRYIADLVTDITDRKQAETELETRLQELNALQRLMSREGWQGFQSAQGVGVKGYLFDELSVLPVETVENGRPVQGAASGNGNSLTQPVSVHGEVIGTLGIYDDPENPISPEDQEFLNTISEQIAEALERARLLEQSRTALAEVEQSHSQTERLYQANRRLSAAPDLQEAVAAVIEGVAAPDIDRAVLIIFERDNAGEIEFGVVEGNWHNGAGPLPTPVGTRHPISVIQTLKFAMSKDPFFFNDTFNDERVDSGSMEVFRRQEIRAVASLPLWAGNTQLGALLVEAAVPHTFTQAEIEPFISLAAQLTVTVENQRLFQQTQTALAEIEATQRQYTVQAWEAYRTRKTQQKYEQNREGVAPLGKELPPEISEAVALKKATVKMRQPSLTSGNQTTNDDRALVEGAISGLAVPLTVRDQVIGVLGLQETDQPRQWLPEEIALVEAIAEQMAQAAENIRLLDDTQQRAAREQRVNEIGDKIQGAQSLEEALQIAVKEVGLSLEAPQTKVKLSVD